MILVIGYKPASKIRTYFIMYIPLRDLSAINLCIWISVQPRECLHDMDLAEVAAVTRDNATP